MDSHRSPKEPRHGLQTRVLVDRAKRGDERALGALLERFEPHVQRIVRRRIGAALRSRVESGDVVQDTLMAVLRSIPGFDHRDDRSFLRWLSTVVENRLRNLGRSSRRERLELLDLEAPEHDVPASGETVDSTVHDEDERRLLELALGDLTPEHRRVIELRHFSQLTFRQIGLLMQRSPDAVWMLHKRAKAALARAMDSRRRNGDGPPPA